MGFDEDDFLQEGVQDHRILAEVLPKLFLRIETPQHNRKLTANIPNILRFFQHQQKSLTLRHKISEIHQQGPIIDIPVIAEDILAGNVHLLDLHGLVGGVVEDVFCSFALVVDFLTAFRAEVLFAAFAEDCLGVFGGLLALLAEELELVFVAGVRRVACRAADLLAGGTP